MAKQMQLVWPSVAVFLLILYTGYIQGSLPLSNNSPGNIVALKVDGNSEGLSSEGYLRYLEDSTSSLTAEQVLSLPESAWRLSDAKTLNFSFTDSTFWFSLKVKNIETTADQNDYVLLCNYPVLDEIEFITVDSASGNILKRAQTGDHYPFRSRPIAYRAFSLPLEIAAGQTSEVLIAARTKGNLALPLTLWSADKYYEEQQRAGAFFGLLTGIILIMALYNLFIYVRSREPVFILFSFFASTIVCQYITQSGYAYEYFWPTAVWWNEVAILFFAGLVNIAHYLFSISFLTLSQWPRINRAYRMMLLWSALLTVASLTAPYEFVLKPLILTGIFGCILSISVGIYLWAQRSAGAKVYTIAWSAFLIGILLSLLNRYDVFPHNTFTEFAPVFGSLATILMLSFTIGDRINSEKQAKIAAQNEAIDNLAKYEALYENSVEGIYISSLTGKITDANPAFLNMLGYENLQQMRERIGETVVSVYKEPNQREELINRLREEGQIIDHEVEMVRSDGSDFWVSMTMRMSSEAVEHDPVIEGAIVDISARKASESKLLYLSKHDPLTNLFNRREFENQLKTALRDARESGERHSVLYIDLDQFKVVNDTCGHTAGDILLRQLTHMLLTALSDRGLLARLGGDEFGVLIRNSDEENALKIAEELRQVVQNYRFVIAERAFTLGVSIGLVAVAPYSESIEKIMSLADTACFMAKDSGRNRIHVYSESNTELQKRRTEMEWVSAINNALQRDSFVLYQQTIAACEGEGDLMNYEILLRMLDNDGKIVSPAEFLPAAERYNLMPALDRWVIGNTFKWLSGQAHHVQRLKHCSINLSGQSLGDETLEEFISGVFKTYAIPYDKICFEITESSAIQNLSHTLNFIDVFRKLGCRFALDDFGSGFSSYGYLKNLPVDYLKIDGVFVRNMAVDHIDYAMVRSIRDVANAIGMYTIAEFVENDDIRQKLKEVGVDYLQGYGVARPQPLTNYSADVSAQVSHIG